MALLVLLGAAMVLASRTAHPALAAEEEGSDEQLIADVLSYAKETYRGDLHVRRWVRVLHTLGALDGMTAARAQEFADRGWTRWAPVAAELTRLESAAGGGTPDPQLVADVEGYAQETAHGWVHVRRWSKVLISFGALDAMTAAEAQGYADRGWPRWVPVAAELASREAPVSEPEPVGNRAPVVDTEADNYDSFVSAGNAPRGTLVTKPYLGIFSDPDGDQLTYHLSGFIGELRLIERFGIFPDGQSDESAAQSSRSLRAVMRVIFEADADDDWDIILPPLPDEPIVEFTLTATDPDGLSASVQGSFKIAWERQEEEEAACALTAPSSVSAAGIERAAVVSWTLPEDLDAGCEVSGFAVGASGASGAALEDRVTDPEARTHIMQGIEPGDYRFYVRIVYSEGSSEELITLKQVNVPAVCDIELNAQPYAGTMISGSWRSVAGTPSGCVSGPTIEFHIKRTEDDYFNVYGLFPNQPQPDLSLPGFIIGSLEPYVSYDFKIVGVDAAGQKNESNVASATIVSNDASVPPDANSPLNLRVTPNNSGAAVASWERPASFGPGSFSAWDVEWVKLNDDGTPGASNKVSLTDVNDTEHTITGLDDGARYVVRVASRTTDASNVNYFAYSPPAPAFTAMSEPFQFWFESFSDGLTYFSGRVWLKVRTNKPAVAGTCHVHNSSYNCPPNNLVSATSDVSGEIQVKAVITVAVGDQPLEFTGYVGEAGGPAAPRIWASGANRGLLVEWTGVSAGTKGTLDAYIVQHRQGTSGTWTDTELTDTSLRSHYVTGLTNGNLYQVRVRGRSANLEDHDNDPDTPDETVHYLGFTSEIVTVNVSWLYQLPRWPEGLQVTPGSSSLLVEWEYPRQHDRSLAHAYQVRHRLRGTGEAWTESDPIYPINSRRICTGPTTCVNPRSYNITGLEPGKNYEVSIRSKNANGWGEWLDSRASHFPNN